MNRIHLSLVCCACLLIFAVSITHVSAYEYDLEAVTLEGGAAGVTIRGAVNSDTVPVGHNVFFSPDERVQVSIEFRSDNATDQTGRWFVVCRVNDEWYMKDVEDNWTEWDRYIDHLAMAAEGSFEKGKRLVFSAGPGLPTGEYAIYAGMLVKNRLIYTKKALSFAVLKDQHKMHRIRHDELLDAYFSTALQYMPVKYDDMLGAPVSGPSGTAPSSDASTDFAGFSRTNIQEEGVDEADLVKTDGDILYMTDWCGKHDSDVCLDAYRLQEHPAGSESVGTLRFDASEPGALYLVNDVEKKHDTVVYVTGDRQGCYAHWDAPAWWYGGKTVVKMVDVEDPASMKLTDSLLIEGVLISSRRIGDMLYIVTRSTPYLPYRAKPDPVMVKSVQLQRDSISDFVPHIEVNGKTERAVTLSFDFFVLPVPPDEVPEATMVTVTAVPVYDPEQFHSVSMAGATETMYMSSHAIYLASSFRNSYDRPVPAVETVSETMPADSTSIDPVPGVDVSPPVPPVWAQDVTVVHKFLLSGRGVNYTASGRVPGSLGWESDKKPFRMSEYRDILRIVTSSGESWNNTSSTSLFTLKESAKSGILEILGRLEGLGMPGERLYASRFSGDRGFLVTFRVTDPLYIIDLADPAVPTVAGTLHINGYSDYLHLLNKNYLLGIGKDAIPDTSSSDSGGRGAWYQGVKLSLFDITPGSQPKEINSIVLGKRGTESEVLRDHHALAWLGAHDDGSVRFAIPVALHETMPDREGFDPSKPNAYWDWTSTGVHVFQVDLGVYPFLDEIGSMIVVSPDKLSEHAKEYDEHYTSGDRSVIQGSAIHYIHNGKIYSANLADLQD